ncbi:Histidinol dehydrogenase [Rhodopirellula baltica SH28]|uniref:Histidinol dehydrogenase n=1 Tax=Rhodopirellula baltica SH28 TaxID=993517 RepID=K5CE81_RHOBT|nr:histidinol dehydrogenase [Rhodopirellula baltica]EKK02065.1 Histidinol dehydrogenase [Rhodopirellula baltica SH28]
MFRIVAVPEFSIQTVDARDPSSSEAAETLAALREKLSPRGDLVSPRGRELTLKVFGKALSPIEVVETICKDVQSQGTEALLRYTKSLDGAELTADTLRVPEEDLKAAHAVADPKLIETIGRIRDNIATFQSAILHRDVTITPRPGVSLTQRYVPIPRVGICVPGGAAAYPSTVMMTAIPAQVAGVDEIAVVAPPTPFGAYNTDMLATCHELGIKEVYRCGGAQAVAAMAYGCDALPAVDKIVGPGNLFVALAKKHVFGTVDIDSFAGPSEVIVIADESANAAFVASDLLAQAEHSPGSAILITWDESLLTSVQAELSRQLGELERGDLARDALSDFGALVLARDADHACELTDSFAPEHLQIETREPESLIAKIRHSGAAFLGHYTPVALGDYAAGPSHVLPTGGTCRWAAGLSANSFLRSGSVTQFDQSALSAIAQDVITVAEKEGLTAHARSISIRTE